MKQILFGIGLSICFATTQSISIGSNTPKMIEDGRVSIDGENEFRFHANVRPLGSVYTTARRGKPIYQTMIAPTTLGVLPHRWLPDQSFKTADVLETFFDLTRDRVYFVSNKGSANPDNYDIWMAKFDGQTTSDPKRLPSPINSTAGEWYPSVGKDYIMFGSEREKGFGGLDIYMADYDGTAATNVRLMPKPINSVYEDFDPILANDGSFLIFSSNRPSKYAGSRLFMIFRRPNNTWSRLVNLGKELAPYISGSAATLSKDESVLYFTAGSDGRKAGDIYSIGFQPILERLKAESKE